MSVGRTVHQILVVLGVDDPTGPWYSFWSGFGSDLSYFGVFAVLYRKHNCHVHGCWRIGRHLVDDTGHVVCARHHPKGAPKVEDL